MPAHRCGLPLVFGLRIPLTATMLALLSDQTEQVMSMPSCHSINNGDPEIPPGSPPEVPQPEQTPDIPPGGPPEITPESPVEVPPSQPVEVPPQVPNET